MTNETYDREKLTQKNPSYESDLKEKFSETDLIKINKCIDDKNTERELLACLKEELSDEDAEQVMRILGFITLGG